MLVPVLVLGAGCRCCWCCELAAHVVDRLLVHVVERRCWCFGGDRLLVLGAGRRRWCCELAVHVVETGCRCWCWCCELVERGCRCWAPSARAGAGSWLCTWWRQGGGAGAGCWLCAWWRQGAGRRCWVLAVCLVERTLFARW